MHALIDFPAANERCRLAFAQPTEVLRAAGLAAVPALVARAWDLARAGAWVVGHVAYEAAPAFDAAMPVRALAPPLPFACFAVYAQPAAHKTRSEAEMGEPEAPYRLALPWLAAMDRTRAMARMEDIRAAIARGAVYQVNLTTLLRAGFTGDSLAFFHALRRAQPGGYCLYLDGGSWQVLSVSPELFFDWTADGTLTARPMKGTAARHADPARDAAAMRAMQESPKERAENLMIVDLLRNDLSRVAQAGSVQVPALFAAEALPTAWQMTSTISCRTRAGAGLDDIFRALFPCGSVTGAPKIAAMSAIAALEDGPRGVYCGALGLIRPGGHATFSVGIRTVVIDRAAGQAQCGIGSGITWDSQPADEWEEWQVKQRFLQRAVEL